MSWIKHLKQTISGKNNWYKPLHTPNKVEEKANREYKCKTYKVEHLTSQPLFFMHISEPKI